MRKLLKDPHVKEIMLLMGASLLLHLVAFGAMSLVDPREEKEQTRSLRLTVVPKKEDKPAVIEEVREEPTPKPKPKPKPPKPKKVQQLRKPKKAPKKNAQKVQGLSEDAVTDGPSNISAPLGNTLMRKDEGKRLSPDELEALERDLSSDALLIQGSFVTPEYTQAALDANLEGAYLMDVYVDAKGNVVEAELRKPIGYGMDAGVLEAARSARFVPRKNAQGVPLSGWAEIKFYLEIP